MDILELLLGVLTIAVVALGYIVFNLLSKFSNLSYKQDEKFGLISQQISMFQQSITDANNAASNQTHSILKSQLEPLVGNIQNLSQLFDNRMQNLSTMVDEKLFRMQADSNEKLEKIRYTVDEKLHETLEQRLGDTFKIVSERLEQVHRGIGEMQTLATGVGDLKKILSNVKTRGVWGEVQLESILDQMMSSHQYIKNVSVKEGSMEKVEFAVKLPSKEDDSFVMLPIDAKFPLDVYQKLIAAQDVADIPMIETYSKELEQAIKKQAKMISDKYINVPITTEFAIMFVPIEGLYAEIMRIPGLMEYIQHNHRIVVTGPTTLSAILSSLQMGYRTLAIQKRSNEVWKLLAVVRKEFVTFSDLLGKTKLKLDQASRVIGDAETKTRTIQRKLKNLEIVGDEISENDNDVILPLPNIESQS